MYWASEEVINHETQKTEERRKRPMREKVISKDDLIDLLVLISVITKRIAKHLNNQLKEEIENE